MLLEKGIEESSCDSRRGSKKKKNTYKSNTILAHNTINPSLHIVHRGIYSTSPITQHILGILTQKFMTHNITVNRFNNNFFRVSGLLLQFCITLNIHFFAKVHNFKCAHTVHTIRTTEFFLYVVGSFVWV